MEQGDVDGQTMQIVMRQTDEPAISIVFIYFFRQCEWDKRRRKHYEPSTAPAAREFIHIK